MLKIRKLVEGGRATLILSGRIEGRHLPEIKELLEAEADVENKTLDLAEVRLVDGEAIAFLSSCEAAGMELKNCPSYVRVWIDTRRDTPNEA